MTSNALNTQVKPSGEAPGRVRVRDADEEPAVESHGTAREAPAESDTAAALGARSGIVAGVQASVDFTDEFDAGRDRARDGERRTSTR